jgi:hypothetical protein
MKCVCGLEEMIALFQWKEEESFRSQVLFFVVVAVWHRMDEDTLFETRRVEAVKRMIRYPFAKL